MLDLYYMMPKIARQQGGWDGGLRLVVVGGHWDAIGCGVGSVGDWGNGRAPRPGRGRGSHMGRGQGRRVCKFPPALVVIRHTTCFAKYVGPKKDLKRTFELQTISGGRKDDVQIT